MWTTWKIKKEGDLMSNIIKYPSQKITKMVRDLFEENIEIQTIGSEAILDEEYRDSMIETICAIVDAVIEENE